MRRFVLIFNHFEEVHLGKDVYLFPYYWKQEYGDEVETVSYTHLTLPTIA